MTFRPEHKKSPSIGPYRDKTPPVGPRVNPATDPDHISADNNTDDAARWLRQKGVDPKTGLRIN